MAEHDPGRPLARDVDLEQTLAALRESERRLATLISNLPGFVYRCRNDADWTMEFVSDGCVALTGYTATDLVGNRTISYADLVHPEDRGWLWEACESALATRRPCQNEYRIITARQETRWVWEQARGVHDADGSLLFIEGFIQDITGRKESEARQRLVMQELDHRVKNNLASVLAIVEETLSATRSRHDFAETFGGRIHVMARVHEVLAAARWAGVDVAKLVRLALGTVDPRRVRIEGQGILLPPRSSAPLALALHELATNAVRHGSLSGGDGRVEVSWAHQGEHLRLRWAETGGPAVAEPADEGLGVRLVTGFVRKELGGRVEFSYPETGLVCEMLVPLTLATRPASS